ncbi:MAG: response regulator receiver protein [Pedosphaera sp.]|nr:response regulator receiver protein [Pedosphaera sp.]
MTTINHNEPILIVEDNADDADLLRIALQKNKVTNPIHIVENGLEAIKYLRAEAPYSERGDFPFPTIIYTDLKMPFKDGFEVLQWIKDHPQCCVIPVIIMTSSSQDSDVRKAYTLGANSYIVKPGSLNELTEVIGLAIKYWAACLKSLVHGKC